MIPLDVAHALTQAYDQRYRDRTEQELAASCSRVGDRRYMVTVAIEPPFDSPELYANPFIFPLLTSALGSSVALLSFGMVMALAGSRDQQVHRDHSPLFPEVPLGGLLPCYAATVVVPLVDLDPATVGTTALWPGSHREAQPALESFDSAVLPRARLGSVYMMDYRLVHAGMGNRSDTTRPILYVIYSRPWFTDAENYTRQAKVSISPERLAAVPEAYRSLFAHVRP
ncbi:MAG: phytanoyl-CoA dioxygenase family protein [Vicinamibacterales bacterium]